MGEISRGYLKVNDSRSKLKDKQVDFMFNPTEYSVSKNNKWELKANKSGNTPNLAAGTRAS